jgi:hypothetical protein
VPEDPITEELRISQEEREEVERQRAREARTEEGTEAHDRRADKADYLRGKLEERADAEREAEEHER